MPPLHEGALSIRSGSGVKGIKRWLKRFVVLTPDVIVPFLCESQLLKPDLEQSINLASVVRIVHSRLEPCTFFVYHAKKVGKRSLKAKCKAFEGLDAKSTRDWVNALVDAMRTVRSSPTERRSSLPARKRFSLPFVVSHFGQVGADDHISKALSPRRRSMMRMRRSLTRRGARDFLQSSLHNRTVSQVSISGFTTAQLETHSSFLQHISNLALQGCEESESKRRKALIGLLGDYSSVLQTMLSLANEEVAESTSRSLPPELGPLLISVMENRRFAEAIEVLFQSDDPLTPEAVSAAIRLRWWILKQQMLKHELSSSSVRDHFACFLSENVSGDRFIIAAKDAVVSCLRGHDVDCKTVANPEVWKGLLRSTLNCPMEVKNEMFKDIAFLVVDNGPNAETLCSQTNWLQWLLQPVLFTRLADMDKHMRLRMLFLTLLHFHLFFNSSEFESTLVQTLCRLHLWGLDGRVAANAMLECLVAKLHGSINLFPHDYDRVVWKNLVRLLRVVQVFVFCTGDWDKQQHMNATGDARRMSTTRVEAEPRSPSYYFCALDDAANPKTLGQRRFAPHLNEEGESDVVESCFKLTKALGLLDDDFGDINQGRLDSVSAKAVSLSAREMALAYRDSIVFLLLLEMREQCVSQLQIRILTRSFVGAQNKQKRLETLQKLSRLPMCESQPTMMLSGANARTNTMFISVLYEKARLPPNQPRTAQAFIANLLDRVEVSDRRVQMRMHRLCFTGSDLVRYLVDQQYAADTDAATVIGVVLHGTTVINSVTENIGFSNSGALFRFACHENEGEFESFNWSKTELSDISGLPEVDTKDSHVFDFVYAESSALRVGERHMTMSQAIAISLSPVQQVVDRRPSFNGIFPEIDDGTPAATDARFQPRVAGATV